ncbi:uncharacterized protein ALTATR162_LOCUS11689 [Alternaria atra]|uniref:Carboxylic ester hydrolase n=1 Tax=Alternaria atra TaxID=119953 RepID=A0A8J2IBH1_9PLEO|nr:uncharacterized protein ALTATR162_LOCUS11689 [Alternaria atra]CAG5186738.1 unnamed protein product [Alternaria atra]
MSSPAIAGSCASATISTPSIFGARILSIEATIVQNYAYASSIYNVVANHGHYPDTTIDFCNVTVTHTHPGTDDTLHTEVWLPLRPSWNGRLQMAGGGGWVAGLDELARGTMFTALSEGYVTSRVDAGIPTTDFTTAKDWALTSPGNVNYNRLQNFAMIGLHDGALITKSVIKSFYGRPADYSYWSGCSQGGRQGHMFAQRYPDVFDGIAVSAPAINWAPFFVGQTFPQQVLYELGEFPHTCEYDTLTAAVIKAYDGNDGLLDGLISHPDSCSFDPYELVGTPVNCNVPGAPAVISKAAAAAMDAAWHGTRAADGSLLWSSSGYEANTTNGVLLSEGFTDDSLAREYDIYNWAESPEIMTLEE